MYFVLGKPEENHRHAHAPGGCILLVLPVVWREVGEKDMSVVSIALELADQVKRRPLPKSPRQIVVPDADDSMHEAVETLGHAEGQSFVIEYLDSARRPSTRRVTVWGIVAGANGVPSLIAHCHERNAQRQFRVDRIQSFVDYDGEIFVDVPAFMAENFGMDIRVARREPGSEDRWKNVLSSVKHDAVILAALARSDGETLRVELEAAVDHLSRTAERQGVMLDEAEILSIYRYANRLRPSEEAIERALKYIAGSGADHVRRLLLAAASVVDSDGRRHPREIALINAVAVDLIGVPLI